MLRSARFVVLMLWLLGSPVWAGSHVQLVLDASGSMWNKLDDGRFRITADKEALNGFVEGLPDEEMNVGLRIYGSRVKAGSSGACEDSELVVPMEGMDKARLKKALKRAKAVGATPIALSLKLAAADFPADAPNKLIVLVTDGKEACDGDLKAAAAGLKGIELKIIGFDLDDEAARSFEGLGSFENAADAKSLAAALGRAVAEVVPPIGEASLSSPSEVSAGAAFEVSWTGPGHELDYVTLVEKGTEDNQYGIWKWTRDGGTLSFIAPLKAGSYELRYQSDRVPGVAARRPIQIVEAKFGVSPPLQIPSGSQFEVPWIGPNSDGDYITIVKQGAADGDYLSYAYTRDGSPAVLNAPVQLGAYEVRYQSERESGIFATVPVMVIPVEVVMKAPGSVERGSLIEVEWSGPDDPSDYITIVKRGAADGEDLSYVYTSAGNPGTLAVPDEVGDYELRYASERVSGTFARRPIRVE